MENKENKQAAMPSGMNSMYQQTREEGEETIDLMEIFYLMWENLWKILACLLAGAVIAFVVTYFGMTPMYQATAKLYLVSKADSSATTNMSDLQMGSQLVDDYQELLKNHELLQEVVDNLGLDMTYSQLGSMISVSSVDSTRILRITVKGPDPKEAADIANEVAQRAIVFLPQVMGTAEPNIAETAVVPESPVSPSKSKNTLIGGLLGAVLCAGIILVRFLLDDTIKNPDDLNKYFGIQPLATLTESDWGQNGKKRGKGKGRYGYGYGSSQTVKTVDYNAKGVSKDADGLEGFNNDKMLQIKKLPVLPFDVTESLNQLRVNLGFCGSDIKTIMITSSTPDEGKSFVSMNLWRMMAETGARTLLIDADLRNSEMRTAYGIVCEEKLKGIVYYLAGKTSLENAIYRTNIPNGYMIPMASAIANPSILLESNNFKVMLEECAKHFDYIILDTPPLGSVADALNIATHCDGTVLVVRGSATPRKLVDNSIQMLRRTETPLLGVVLNRAKLTGKSGGYYRYGGYYYKGKEYGAYGKDVVAAPNANSMPTTTQSNVSRPNVTRSASSQGKKTRPSGERPSRQGGEQQVGRMEDSKQPSGSGYKGGSKPARENADSNANGSRGSRDNDNRGTNPSRTARENAGSYKDKNSKDRKPKEVQNFQNDEDIVIEDVNE